VHETVREEEKEKGQEEKEETVTGASPWFHRSAPRVAEGDSPP
jgi:hypothetical protein